MFKSLRTKYFQSHRNTFLDLSEGVNVILGLSQSGKTALIRSLRLLIDNRPSGAKYYSRFAPDKGATEIELETREGDKIKLEKIVRRKKDGEKELEDTIYYLNGQDFSGTQKDVPDQIRDALNMGELNIQRQFDQPFLIISSAGEVARTINRITKLDQVDNWVTVLTKRINEQRRETDLLEKQAKEIEIELAKYKGFEDLEVIVESFNVIAGELKAKRSQYQSLDQFLVKIEDIQRQLDKLSPALDIAADIEKIAAFDAEIKVLLKQCDLIGQVLDINDEIKELQKLIDDLQSLISMETEHDQWLKIGAGIDQWEIICEDIKELQSLIDDFQSLINMESEHDQWKKIDACIDHWEIVQKEISDLDKKYDHQKEIYISILREQKKCPICLSDIDESIITKLEKKL
jgi:DNA repair protein SbcC/Rad50